MNWYRKIAIAYLAAAAYLIITAWFGASSVVPGWHTRVWNDAQVKRMIMGAICLLMACVSWWLGRKKKSV